MIKFWGMIRITIYIQEFLMDILIIALMSNIGGALG